MQGTRSAWVLLGDVVNSRGIDERGQFESEIDAELRQINRTYDEQLVANFTRLKGIDEIGAVLGSARSLVEIRRDLTLGFHPELLRTAVVRGEVNDLSENDVSQMDGGGFATAADELNQVEKANRTFRMCGLPMGNDIISECINIIDYIRSRWTEERVRAIRAYQRKGSQVEAAKLLGVSRQAVNKHLNSQPVQLVQQTEEIVSDEIKTVSTTTDTKGF